MKQNLGLNVDEVHSIRGGYSLGDNRYMLNTDNCDRLYKVALGTGTAWCAVFFVTADTYSDAIDKVATFCEENGYTGLYYSIDRIIELMASDGDEYEDYSAYADAQGWVWASDTGVYVDLQMVDELEQNLL